MLLSMTSNRLDSIVQLITAVCIFIFVLALAYFTTKFTAGFQKSKLASPNVEVIETFRLTQNKYIQIVSRHQILFHSCLQGHDYDAGRIKR